MSQGIVGITHPSTPPPPPPSPQTPTPLPPPSPSPPPPLFNMENTMKIHVFKGVGTEDPKQFWFVVDTVWKAQWIT